MDMAISATTNGKNEVKKESQRDISVIEPR
jgi:hypothetical protein